ncbi:16800_t:CDS:10 [Funneliformis caledonium]|uniref:16800_t:CDS:1 n=1 Tax=Funneliformis caledonium TaxID=1117310 RepID=A0A9N9N4J5_9GLOM|nr:16800_t:CDS:10 [Funneliformis caledonium]
MPKRKKSDVDASRKEWEPFVKILEKPDKMDRRYQRNLKKTFFNTYSKACEEKLLDAGQDPLFSESVTSGKGSFFYWAILCFGTIKEQKSRAVVSFWEEASDRQKKRELGNTLFSMHFEGFSELDDDKTQDDSNDSHAKDDDKTQDDSNDSHAEDYDSEENTKEEYYAYIIDLDNISEQTKPAFCSIDAWKTIISSSNISTSLPSSVDKQIEYYLKDINDTDEEKYTHKVFDHFIFCLENRPEYFAQRPTTEGTFRARFIEPIMEPFIFIFKDLMDLNCYRRNFNLSEGKRRRIGSKSDCIGSIVNADDKELLIFELSGAPTRLPTRHPEGDKVKLDRCMVDVLNNLLGEYKTCEFTLAKEFKAIIVGCGLYCRKTLSQFTLPTKVLDLYYLYDLLRSMFCFRDELVKSLGALQRLKVAKARKPDPIDPVSHYILRLPPS